MSNLSRLILSIRRHGAAPSRLPRRQEINLFPVAGNANERGYCNCNISFQISLRLDNFQ